MAKQTKYANKLVRSGWDYLRRQGFLSFATALVIFIAVVLGTTLMISQGAISFMSEKIKDKIDVSVYFNEQVSKDKILEIRERVAQLPEVKNVDFISSEEAYDAFVKNHEGDTYAQSLEAIGGNPFLPSLVIQTKDPLKYETVSDYFRTDEFKDMVYDINDYRRGFAIERLSSLSSGMERLGIILTVFLSLIAIIVTYNTLRLSIYSRKNEIEIMRLVGAKNSFVRGPFMVQGALCGFFAAVLSFVFFLVIFFVFRSGLESIFMGFNPFNYFISNWWLIFLLQIVIGVGLGLISSFFAVRRYLKD
ncbi:MAG: permease-like cell division protein FtsX [Candidatus Pacebacteria bacterium]|nr:permease-like cell division protein FtsX [Candidatus Paceibacterota bacterium]